jgi:hypothetical protein
VNLFLKDYADPPKYRSTFDYNYSVVNNIENDRLCQAYVQYLADSTKVTFEIILIDLKRYILCNQEYSPSHIRKKLVHLLVLPFYFVNALSKIRWKRSKSNGEILIDDWYKNSAETFYGRELISRLNANWRTLAVDFQSLAEVDLRTFISTIPAFVRSFFHASKILKAYGIDLRRYTYSFFTKILEGKTIEKYYRPKLVISGNDNDMSVVKAKAAGAAVLLIQNGLRPYWSNSCFKFADYYISMGTDRILKARTDQGCQFKRCYSLGSLRLYNYLQQSGNVNSVLLYDVLWVSTCGLGDYDSTLKSYYLATDEHKAIRTFNDLVDKKNLRAAYQCRYTNEMFDLRRLGLFNDKVTYIEAGSKSVYQSVAESSVVFSSWSTVCHEAMGLKKKIGFVNLSGNDYVNYIFEELAIEYTGKGDFSPEDFFVEIKGREFDYNNYMIQSSSYVDELIGVVGRALAQ